MSGERGDGRRAKLRGWLPLLIAAVAYTVFIGVVLAHRAESSTDFRDYWQTAKHFRETGEISAELGVHNYLPFFTIFMLPWSLLPLKVAAVAFTALSLGLVALAVVMVEILLAGGLAPRPRAATWLALGLMLPYLYSASVLGAVGLMMMFLLVAVWFLFERRYEWEAGAVLGLATLIKLVPGLLVIFFLLKGRWRVALAAAAVTVVFGLGMPLISLGVAETKRQHTAFFERAAQGHSAWNTITADQPRKIYYKNNALPAVLRRLGTHINATPDERGSVTYVNVVDWPRSRVFAVYAGLLAVILVGSVMAGLRPPRWAAKSPAEVNGLRAQFGVWCAAMLLASPLLWVHYLPMVYWPLAVVAERATRRRWVDVGAVVVWGLGAVLLVWPAARAAGAQIFALGIVWLVLVRGARRGA
ncbi:MAG: glycosyltransferase family 87 protein [Phycisphaerae bacterium]|jgi:hypothetical protein